MNFIILLLEYIMKKVFSLLLLFFLFQGISAQDFSSRLEMKWIDYTQYPTIRAYFNAYCAGLNVFTYDKTKLSVFENDIPVGDFELYCPNNHDRCKFSLGFMLDASGSIAPNEHMDIIRSTTTIIRQMDGQIDDASMVFLNGGMYFYPMGKIFESDTTKLIQTVNSLPYPGGNTPLYDAILEETKHLSSRKNECSALIVFSDGFNNRGIDTADEIMSIANANNIRIFVIAMLDSTDIANMGASQKNLLSIFKSLAEDTGGEFFISPQELNIDRVIEQITESFHSGFRECFVEYTSTCPNGENRDVRMVIDDVCNDNLSYDDTLSYVAPLDSTYFTDVHIRTGREIQITSTRVEYPFTIMNLIPDNVFEPFEMAIYFDTSCMIFEALQGNMINSDSVTYYVKGDKLIIRSTIPHIMVGTGELFKVQFNKNSSTQSCNINIDNLLFLRGCLNPILHIESSILSCGIMTIDTVRFVDTLYVPEQFSVHVLAINGSFTQATNVHAYVLQDHNFLIVGEPQADLGTIDPLKQKNHTFTLTNSNNVTGGYDTVTVMLVSDQGTSICKHVIYIEPEIKPVIELRCIVDPTAVFYNDSLGVYVPDVVKYTVTMINRGNGILRDATLYITGMKRFVVGEWNINPTFINIGTLNPNQQVTYDWYVIPIPQKSNSWDTLTAIGSGKGGFKNKLRMESCDTYAYISKTSVPEYQLDCMTIAPIVYDESIMDYVPNPFQYNVRVTNVGTALGKNITIRIASPIGTYTIPQNDEVKTIDILPMGESVILTWNFYIERRSYTDTSFIPTTLIDLIGNYEECSSEVIIPSIQEGVQIKCDINPRQFTLNSALDGYNESNTVLYSLSIKNNSSFSLTNVHAIIDPPSQFSLIDSLDKFVATELMPNQEVIVTWELELIRVYKDINIPIKSSVMSDQEVNICVAKIYVPMIPFRGVECRIESFPESILHYIDGDYEGSPSVIGRNYFELVVHVINTSGKEQDSIYVDIHLPSGVRLDYGESNSKYMGDFIINQLKVVSFRVLPYLHDKMLLETFTAVTHRNGIVHSNCSDFMYIEGTEKKQILTIPKNVVGQYLGKVRVPVLISPTIGNDLRAYNLHIRYEDEYLRFIQAEEEHQYTGTWRGLRFQLTDNIISLENYTTGRPLNTKIDVPLFYMVFEVIKDQTSYHEIPVEFYNFTDISGKHINSLNAESDSLEGEIKNVEFYNGSVIVVGRCIPILSRVGLEQNYPNPFSETTKIKYFIPDETHVRLYVTNILSKFTKMLVDEYKIRGDYEVDVSASDYESGMYFYTLEVDWYSASKKMVIFK